MNGRTGPGNGGANRQPHMKYVLNNLYFVVKIRQEDIRMVTKIQYD